MGKKTLCRIHEREKLELAERALMDSWLCLFYDDVFCPHSGIPRQKRVGLVCLGCPHYSAFEREMGEEDERLMDEIDEIEDGSVAVGG